MLTRAKDSALIVIDMQERLEAAETSLNDLYGVETEFGGYRGELTDQTPATAERIDTIKERIQDLQQRAVGVVPRNARDESGFDAAMTVQNADSLAAAIPFMPKK